jgi:hypothetical protein
MSESNANKYCARLLLFYFYPSSSLLLSHKLSSLSPAAAILTCSISRCFDSLSSVRLQLRNVRPRCVSTSPSSNASSPYTAR